MPQNQNEVVFSFELDVRKEGQREILFFRNGHQIQMDDLTDDEIEVMDDTFGPMWDDLFPLVK